MSAPARDARGRAPTGTPLAFAMARTRVPQPEASSSITPVESERSHSSRPGASSELTVTSPEPAAERLLGADLVPELRRRLDQGPFEFHRSPCPRVCRGLPDSCLARSQARRPCRSGSSHSGGKTGRTRPGYQGYSRRASSAAGRDSIAARDVLEAHQQRACVAPIWKSAAFGCSPPSTPSSIRPSMWSSAGPIDGERAAHRLVGRVVQPDRDGRRSAPRWRRRCATACRAARAGPRPPGSSSDPTCGASAPTS